MRIAINAWFLDQPGTGSGQYLHGLLRAMPEVAHGHEFLLVVPHQHRGQEAPGLQAQTLALNSRLWAGSLGKVLFEQVAFPRICRRWGADVAHVPYWGSPLWPSVPTVVTIHDLIPLVLPAYRGGMRVQLYTRLVAAAAHRAAVVLTDSLASKQDIEKHLDLPSEKVQLVYLAHGEQFTPEPAPEDAATRRGYGLPGEYVLYLAGHDVRKNVAGLVEAFGIVAQAHEGVELVIGGRLPEREDVLFFDPRPLIAALGLEGVVRPIGWVAEDDKAALYRGAACAIFPSRYEGFGLPVLEALACGTPLVTTHSGALPELAGDAAFTVDPDDVQAMAGAILACLVDERLAAELRRRGPIQAARFSWRKTARETVAAYEEAA